MSNAKDKYFHVSKRGVMLTLAALGLVVAGAALAAYLAPGIEQTAEVQEIKPVKKTAQHAPAPRQQMTQTQPACNDNNIVGTVVGGVGGGVVGSQVGKGSGKTAATIGGALGGAYLGNKYIPTQNTLCK